VKKSFLMINTDGCFLGITQRLDAEGYKTYSFYEKIAEKYSGKGVGKNMINLVDDMYDVINEFKEKKDELIILVDGNYDGDEFDYLRSEGWHIVGVGSYSEHIEHDRGSGNSLAKSLGLNIPPAVEFTDFSQASAYLDKLKVKNNDVKLVFKGDGFDAAGSSFTYLANTVEEMQKYIEWVDKQQEYGCKMEKFRFQKVIDGIEVDFAAWYNGEKFLPGMFVDFEQKRIHGLGKAVGCLGQIEVIVDPTKQPYFQKHLAKLLPDLKKHNVAPNEWAINNIVSKGDPYFLEFTSRFGWDSTIGELALIADAGHSIGEYFEMIAFAKPFPKGYFNYNRYSCTVRLYSGSIGEPAEEVEGKPVFWDEKYKDNFWWYSVKKSDAGHEVTGNMVGCVTYCADSVEEAVAGAYSIIDPRKNNVVIPDLFYSETIGEKVPEMIKDLIAQKILVIEPGKEKNVKNQSS
jgi:phosphoribosylamine-glycine ligase